LEATIESVGLPDPSTQALELRLAVTPAGAPVIVSCTIPVKLPCARTLAVMVVLPPMATVVEAGLMFIEKSEGGGFLTEF
jgi:hypothetical protein